MFLLGVDHGNFVKFNICLNVQYILGKNTALFGLAQKENAVIKARQKREIRKNSWKEE